MSSATESLLFDGSMLWIVGIGIFALIGMACAWRNLIPLLVLPPAVALFYAIAMDIWGKF